MTCKKKQVCNVCDATFKMSRGCLLEKRCPACRFLKLQKNGDLGFKRLKNKLSAFACADNTQRNFRLSDETNIIKFLQSRVNGSVDMLQTEQDPINLIMREEVHNLILECFSSLTDREKVALSYRFGIDCEEKTLEEVSVILKVTRERVRQIDSSAIKKLKHPRVSRKMKEYVEG